MVGLKAHTYNPRAKNGRDYVDLEAHWTDSLPELVSYWFSERASIRK